MKFKVGDKVRVIDSSCLGTIGFKPQLEKNGGVAHIVEIGTWCIHIKTKGWDGINIVEAKEIELISKKRRNK